MSDDEAQGWLSHLSRGLRKTSQALGQSISDVVSKRPLDEAMLESLEDMLIAADVGVSCAASVIDALRRSRFDKQVDATEVKAFLAAEIAQRLQGVAVPFSVDPSHSPYVVLVVGVNGNGKTTTIGKLAHRFANDGTRVVLGAADTFRAAAVDQLAIWAERANVPLVRGAENSDPASVAFQAMEAAQKQQADILMIDTAGRLHTKDTLMAELQKISKVIKKLDPSAPHAVLQVIDGTTGQNALRQIEAFKEVAGVTGLIVTKLDGTTKAGIIVAIADQCGLPIHAIGVGEAAEDLQAFDPKAFADALLEID
jgi:fused signal recognition particle receptor